MISRLLFTLVLLRVEVMRLAKLPPGERLRGSEHAKVVRLSAADGYLPRGSGLPAGGSVVEEVRAYVATRPSPVTP